MKKSVWMLAVALPFAFASCSDSNEDDPMTLDQTSVTINYDGETTVKASEKNCIWESSNPFVATVDNNGKIKAEHVGEAVIIATKEGKSAKCNVTVNATNNNFTMPIINWGNTIDQVKKGMIELFGNTVELGIDEKDALGYTTGGAFPLYTYAFINGGLFLAETKHGATSLARRPPRVARRAAGKASPDTAVSGGFPAAVRRRLCSLRDMP